MKAIVTKQCAGCYEVRLSPLGRRIFVWHNPELVGPDKWVAASRSASSDPVSTKREAVACAVAILSTASVDNPETGL